MVVRAAPCPCAGSRPCARVLNQLVPGATLKIFLVDGTPSGLRTGEVINWTLRAVAAPRNRLQGVQDRTESDEPGVYLLWGPDDENPARTRVYVGEGDPVWPRLRTHQDEKDFWTDLILISSTGDALNKAHIQYLESRLIEDIGRAGVARLDNAQRPALPSLSESDRSDAESLLEKIELLVGVLGLAAFRVAAPPPRQGPLGPPAPAAAQPNVQFVLRGPDAEAFGEDRAQDFVVLSGSRGRLETVPSMPPGYKVLREQLQREGKLVPAGKHIEVAADIPFSSPSAAAAVLLGRSANGLIEWKTKDQGIILKEWQSRGLRPPLP